MKFYVLTNAKTDIRIQFHGFLITSLAGAAFVMERIHYPFIMRQKTESKASS